MRDPWLPKPRRQPARVYRRRRLAAILIVCALVWSVALLGTAKAATLPTGRQWHDLAWCESRLDWSMRSGPYEGVFSFHHTTWDRYRTPTMAPSAAGAPVLAQVWVAWQVANAEGWHHAFPTCSRKVGL